MRLEAWRSKIGDEYANWIESARIFDDEEIATVAFWDRSDKGRDILRVLAAGERGIHDCSVRELPSGELAGTAVLIPWFDVRGVRLIDAPGWNTAGTRSGNPLRPLVGRQPRFLQTPHNATEAEAAIQFEALVQVRAVFNLSPEPGATVEENSP